MPRPKKIVQEEVVISEVVEVQEELIVETQEELVIEPVSMKVPDPEVFSPAWCEGNLQKNDPHCPGNSAICSANLRLFQTASTVLDPADPQQYPRV